MQNAIMSHKWALLRRISLTFGLLSFMLPVANAQEGTLKGRALDVNVGKPIPDFQIRIPSINQQTRTDSLGHYQFTGLPVDTYTLKTAHPKYGDYTVDSVIIRADKVTTRNISVEKERELFQRDMTQGSESLKVRPGARTHGIRQGGVRPPYNREGYDRIESNDFKQVMSNPLSTFSIDVDRASYANTRRFLENGELPPKDAVRIEEFINYFDYDYPEPKAEHPFAIHTEGGECPWNTDHNLLHIGLQGKSIPKSEIPASNLVFLVDVSGSMNSSNKLPLVKSSLRMLVNQLRPKDRISMVVYAGSSGLALPSTPGDQKEKITNAIQNLSAGGSTAGSKGIQLAYEQAKENFIEDGNNRVILATDGDFNVGITSDGALTRLIEEKRESGIFLSILGFGTGNYQGSKMEKLSNTGNGNYTYIDSKLEAKKSLVQEFGGTMQTIAKDVKIQLEFNPAKVKAYRLIGYVNRQLDKEDFKDDSVDAGELGAGHTVTALYELVPADEDNVKAGQAMPSYRYQEKKVKKSAYRTDEIGMLKLRYKSPSASNSQLIKNPITPVSNLTTSNNFYWSAAVAMFGMQLRQNPHQGETSYQLITQTAEEGMGADEKGYREGFLEMVRQASEITRDQY